MPVTIEPATSRWFCLLELREQMPLTVMVSLLLDNSEWIFGTYKLNVLTSLWLLLQCMIFSPELFFRFLKTFWRYLFRVKPQIEFNMTKNCVYSISCSSSKVYKGETYHPLRVGLEEQRKAIVQDEIGMLRMVDHI